MGLDNGITARIKFKDGIKISCELCYWRKFWNFRNEVVQSFEQISEEYEYKLSLTDLKNIKKVISTCIKEKTSEELWGKESTKRIHKKNKKRLAKLITLVEYADEKAIFNYLWANGTWSENTGLAASYLRQNIPIEDIEFIFYDSY